MKNQNTLLKVTFEPGSIKEKGYANYPLIVAIDKRLSNVAKVLYGLLTISANRGSFLKVNDMVKILRIGKDRYYREGIKLLEKYIYVEKIRTYKDGQININHYIIKDEPDFITDMQLNSEKTIQKINKYSMDYPFGIAPTKVIFDNDLSVEAKSIYLYISARSYKQKYICRNKINIMDDLHFKSEATYDRHVLKLKKLNYIETQLIRDGNVIAPGVVYNIVQRPNPDNYSREKSFADINELYEEYNFDVKTKIDEDFTEIKEKENVVNNTEKTTNQQKQESSPQHQKSINEFKFYLERFYNKKLSIDEQKEILNNRFGKIFADYIEEEKKGFLKYGVEPNLNYDLIFEIRTTIDDLFSMSIIDKNGDITTYPIRGRELQLYNILDAIYLRLNVKVLKSILYKVNNYSRNTKNTEGFLITTIYSECKTHYISENANENFIREDLKHLQELGVL